MKSWILIPSYLWKNTFNRWIETPISPISKILVPLLLGLLASLVLIIFSASEDHLKKQLQQHNAYTVYATEVHNALDNSVINSLTVEEEKMWVRKYHDQSKFCYLRQPFSLAEKGPDKIPLILYNDLYSELAESDQTSETLPSWLLSTKVQAPSKNITLTLDNFELSCRQKLMPPLVYDALKIDNLVALPLSSAPLTLKKGFTTHILAHFDDLKSVETFISELKSYHKAEGRNIRIFSTIELLTQLESLQKLQRYIKLGIVLFCGIIISIILGTIAALEYRQESFLLALLRSFGTPIILLLIHAFLENLILVAIGITLAFKIWRPLYSLLKENTSLIQLAPVNSLSLPAQDATIILISGVAGVLIAMIPVAFGLKKPAGLTLQ